jgi:hypothetical protein
MNNRERLIDLMIEHELERREVAELLSVDRATVDCWLASGESSRHLDVPNMAVELLTLKLDTAGGASKPD